MAQGSCSICGRTGRVWHGWCVTHYRRWKKTGDPGADKPIRVFVSNAGLCLIEDCDESASKRGWCDMHYKRWYKTGDPLAVALIKGDDRARFESKVDRSGGPGACHPFDGPRDPNGYCHFRYQGAIRPAHAVAWELEHGPVGVDPELGRRLDVDHECHNQAVLNGTCSGGVCAHRACCNERHLQVKDRLQHKRDTPAYEHAHGSRQGMARLTEADIPLIRAALARGEPHAVIAGRHGVSKPTISQIKRGQTWRHVTG